MIDKLRQEFKVQLFIPGAKGNVQVLNAYVQIKRAYAMANAQLGQIDSVVSRAITQACEEIFLGKGDAHFDADPLQSVSATTFNARINELLARRTEEIIGGQPEEGRLVHLQTQINLNQETEPTFSLAAKLSVLIAVSELEQHILNLERLLRREFLTLVRVLKASFSQTAQTTTAEWGKRLNVFAGAVETVLKRIKETENVFIDRESSHYEDLPGHGSQSFDPERIEKLMLKHLADATGFRLKGYDSVWQNTFVVSDLLLVSGALRDLALVLSKVASVAQKVNPAESSAQPFAEGLKIATYQAISNHLSLTFIGQSEQLEGGLLMPLLSANLLTAIDLLRTATIAFTERGLVSDNKIDN